MRFKYEELNKAPLLVNSIYEGGNKGNPFSDDPLTKLFRIDGFEKSVGTQGGFRKSCKESKGKNTKKIAYTVIKTTGKISEWPDFYDKITGIFIYYGDNRVPGNHYLDTKQKGNLLLENIFKKTYGNIEDRKTIPPMFVFESTSEGSNVRFLGVAIPGVRGKSLDEVLELLTVGEGPYQYQNYKSHLTMLNIEQEGVRREWVEQLKDLDGDTLKYAPEEWVKFVELGI